MVSNGVSCAMIHGVGIGDAGDGWNPIPSLDVYESLLKMVAERRDSLHVDTFGNNAAYAARARNTKLVPENEKPGVYTGLSCRRSPKTYASRAKSGCVSRRAKRCL